MTRVSARWVPLLLIPERKLNRVLHLRKCLTGSIWKQELLHWILTRDESWIHFYEPESKQQSSEWERPESPPPTKVRAGQSALKHAHCFFDYQGIILDHAVLKGSTVNAHTSQWAVKKNRPQMHPDGFILHHDNAPCHTARIIAK